MVSLLPVVVAAEASTVSVPLPIIVFAFVASVTLLVKLPSFTVCTPVTFAKAASETVAASVICMVLLPLLSVIVSFELKSVLWNLKVSLPAPPMMLRWGVLVKAALEASTVRALLPVAAEPSMLKVPLPIIVFAFVASVTLLVKLPSFTVCTPVTFAKAASETVAASVICMVLLPLLSVIVSFELKSVLWNLKVSFPAPPMMLRWGVLVNAALEASTVRALLPVAAEPSMLKVPLPIIVFATAAQRHAVGEIPQFQRLHAGYIGECGIDYRARVRDLNRVAATIAVDRIFRAEV